MRMNIVVKIALAIVVGVIVGLYAPLGIVRFFASIGFLLGEYIKFVIPLLVLAFVAKGIMGFGAAKAGRGLTLGLLLAYSSTVLGSLFGYFVIRAFLPIMNVEPYTAAGGIDIVPFLQVEIPPIMHILTALVLAIVLGLGVTWIGKGTLGKAIEEFHDLVLRLARKGVIPLFPIFISTVFMELAAKGQLLPSAKAFAQVLILIIPTQWAWLLILFLIAGAYTKQNPFPVIRTMLPAYFTAFGTMSSAATLPIALESAHKVPFLREDTVNFCMPLFNIVHMTGASIAINMSAIVVSVLTLGTVPGLAVFLPFVLLEGVIEVGAAGVPGGSVTAALGILESILGFDPTGLGMMMALFMINDGPGTGANVTADAALTMIVNKAVGEREFSEEPA